MEKEIRSKRKIIYGVATVSDKGQIAIPIDLRRDLGIETGEKLIVLKRKDEGGITLVKLSKMDELLSKMQEDEEFFSKK